MSCLLLLDSLELGHLRLLMAQIILRLLELLLQVSSLAKSLLEPLERNIKIRSDTDQINPCSPVVVVFFLLLVCVLCISFMYFKYYYCISCFMVLAVFVLLLVLYYSFSC